MFTILPEAILERGTVLSVRCYCGVVASMLHLEVVLQNVASRGWRVATLKQFNQLIFHTLINLSVFESIICNDWMVVVKADGDLCLVLLSVKFLL